MSPVALLISTAVLIAGMANDLLTRKVKNPVVIISAIITYGFHIWSQGAQGALDGSLAALCALALMLPMVSSRILGAGDMKLYLALSLGLNWQLSCLILFASFFWGALLGVTRSALSGHATTLVKNTVLILRGVPQANITTTQIPYTVALFFGWLTALSWTYYGGVF